MGSLSRIITSRYNEAKTAVNSSYSIADFMHNKGYNLSSNRQICCPFHDDSTPSFSVDLQRNVWKCFGCPDGGHFLDFWIKYQAKYNNKQYTIYSAIEHFLQTDTDLCKELGFSTIFKSENSDYDLFKAAQVENSCNSDKTEGEASSFSSDQKPVALFNFDKVLSREAKIERVNTESMNQVMHKLYNSDISVILKFIENCESGCSESELIDLYLNNKKNTVDGFIQNMLSRTNDKEDVRNALLEALND